MLTHWCPRSKDKHFFSNGHVGQSDDMSEMNDGTYDEDPV